MSVLLNVSSNISSSVAICVEGACTEIKLAGFLKMHYSTLIIDYSDSEKA